MRRLRRKRRRDKKQKDENGKERKINSDFSKKTY